MKIGNINSIQKKNRKRVLELSYLYRLSHIGSCLSALDIIDAVYRVKKKSEHFVLSSGHAAYALYVILEKEHLLDLSGPQKLRIHPDRNPDLGIEVSSGSLGQGLPIALGMALADRKKRVFCLVSDGECAEGSIWEAFRVIFDQKINNLITIVNVNGWGAYDPISGTVLYKRIKGFGLNVLKTDGHNISALSAALNVSYGKRPAVIFARTTSEQFPFLKGQEAHYYIMTEADYNLALEILK